MIIYFCYLLSISYLFVCLFMFVCPNTLLQLHVLDGTRICQFFILHIMYICLFVFVCPYTIAVACIRWDTCCKFLWKPNLKVLRTKTDEFPSNIRFHNFYCGIKVLQIMGIPHSSNMLQFSSTLSVLTDQKVISQCTYLPFKNKRRPWVGRPQLIKASSQQTN